MSRKSTNAPAPSGLPRLLTIAQVAAALAVSRPTIYQFVKRGLLPPPLKFGCATRFREDEVIAALDALRSPRSAKGEAL
jgi:excisionase family DNA binding protein